MAVCGGNRLVQNVVGKERQTDRDRHTETKTETERSEKGVCVMQFVYQLYILTSKCLHTAASQPQSRAPPLDSQVLGSIFNGNPEDVWERAGQHGGESFVVRQRLDAGPAASYLGASGQVPCPL